MDNYKQNFDEVLPKKKKERVKIKQQQPKDNSILLEIRKWRERKKKKTGMSLGNQ